MEKEIIPGYSQDTEFSLAAKKHTNKFWPIFLWMIFIIILAEVYDGITQMDSMLFRVNPAIYKYGTIGIAVFVLLLQNAIMPKCIKCRHRLKRKIVDAKLYEVCNHCKLVADTGVEDNSGL